MSGEGIDFMQNQEIEPTEDQVLEYYDHAEFLLSRGYPTKTKNRHELAKIIAKNEMKKNEKIEDSWNKQHHDSR